MATLPFFYCIHGADAPQHLGKIQQISHKFKQERRISDFIPVTTGDAVSSLAERFRKNDLIVLLLTHELEAKRMEITALLSQIKNKFPESIIVEIIIDNIPFVNDHITLPMDLKPIRNAQDMDGAWKGIEESLNQILPKPLDWKKYLKYAIPLMVALGALFIWKPWQGKSDDFKAAFTVDTTQCTAPCTVNFKNTSSNASSFEWNFGDGSVSSEKDPSHIFERAGTYMVKLVASKEGKQEEETVEIKVVEAIPGLNPKAAFSSSKTTCEAPCTVVFTNSSENADRYRWDFGNGTSSEEVNPTCTFNNSGNFKVKLTALRNGQEDEITQEIVVGHTPAPAPIAGFTPSKTNCMIPCSITFTNQSQNGTSYRWDFGDGTSSAEASPSHRYSTLGQYQVRLVAINSAGQHDIARTITVGATANVPSFQVSTSGNDASIATGDDEIDSDDWTSVELSYSVRIVNSRREIQLAVDWYSQERNSNKSKGNTRYKSSKTFTLFTAPSGAVIDEVRGLVLSANGEQYYSGEAHGFKTFPSTGSLRNIRVKFDADGGHDRQQQGLTATLGAFSVILKAGS
jgi:PKD repeat protein